MEKHKELYYTHLPVRAGVGRLFNGQIGFDGTLEFLRTKASDEFVTAWQNAKTNVERDVLAAAVFVYEHKGRAKQLCPNITDVSLFSDKLAKSRLFVVNRDESEWLSRIDNIEIFRASIASGTIELKANPEFSSERWFVYSDKVDIVHFDGSPDEHISFDENEGERALSYIVYGLCTDRIYPLDDNLPDFLCDEMTKYKDTVAELSVKTENSNNVRQLSTGVDYSI